MIHLTVIGILSVWQAVPRSWTPPTDIYQVALVSRAAIEAPPVASTAVAAGPPPEATVPVNPVVVPPAVTKEKKPVSEPVKKQPSVVKPTVPQPNAVNKTIPTEGTGEHAGDAATGNLVGIGSASSRMTVDSANFPFAYYLNLIRFRLQENWQPPPKKRGQMNTTVKFQILKNGSIVDIQLEKSSGQFMFDQAALRSVHLTNPLPALPVDFPEDHLTVHIEFEGR
jgi:protein TonB